MVNTLDSYQLTQLIMVILAAYVGCQHTLLAFRRRQAALDGIFAALAFSLAAYAALRYHRYDSIVVEHVVQLNWWLWLLEIAALYFFTHFLVLILEAGKRWLLPLVGGMSLVFVFLHVQSPEGFAVRHLGELQPNQLWGLPRYSFHEDVSFWFYVFVVLTVLATSWGLARSWFLAGARSCIRHWALAIAMLIVSAAIISSLGNDLNLWQSPILVHHSFIALIVVMNMAMAEESARTAQLASALAQSREDLRITLDSISDAVIATDATGRIARLNAAAEILLQVDSGQALGRHLHELVELRHAESGATVTSPVDKVLHSKATADPDDQMLVLRGDGSSRRIADRGAAIRDCAGTIRGVVLVCRDITEQVAALEHLQHAQKLEAIGQLAGGVAHDFNNVLSGILGYAELLQTRPDDPDRVREYAQGIERSGEHAAQLTRQLLTISRKVKTSKQHIDMHELIHEVMHLLSSSITSTITLQANLEADSDQVLGDRAQLHSVLLNLAINARDAMPDGGNLSIRTSISETIEHCLRGYRPQEGPYLRIDIMDTGEGMTPELIERVCEPFFTTKQDKGTGLGMTVVANTIRDHHGAMDISSIAGHGTHISIWLPLDDGSSTRITCVEQVSQVHDLHALIVDDESTFRTVVAQIFKQGGNFVSLAASGEEAIALLRLPENVFDIVICDWHMPGLYGTSLVQQMRALRPQLPIILTSGTDPNHELRQLLLSPGIHFLAKPFRQREMLQLVAQILDTRTPLDAC